MSFGIPVPMASVTFTAPTAGMVDALIRDIQAVAKVTAVQAGSTSLRQMRSFNGRVDAATAAALAEMKVLRQAINAQPTASEEP